MDQSPFANTPEPPYYAVIFTSQRTDGDNGYEKTALRMLELAAQQPGFIGFEGARNPDGFGISVSYWESEAAIRKWKAQLDHRAAQERGRQSWYARYLVQVAKVERRYGQPDQGSTAS